MGHLSNPIAYRLNYNKKWADTWFMKNLYYPEFLNKMLNIRDYFYYFFTKKSMLKSGFCLSHLNIIKIKKLYIIKVFIYSIDLEKLSYDFINKIYNLYYLTLKKYTGKIFGVPKIELKKQLEKKRFINELHNSDLFAFIFIHYFFELFIKSNNKIYIKNNKFLINKNSWYSDILLKRYISYIFFKLKLWSVRKTKKKFLEKFTKKWIFFKRLKNIEYRKKKSLVLLFKKIKLVRSKINFKKHYKIYLDYFKVKKQNKVYWKKYKLFIQKLKNKNIQKLKNKIYKITNEKILYKQKLNFYDFFFIILKKMKFEKFNNTLALHYKWSKAKVLLNSLKNTLKIKNKTSLYFLLQAFISTNKMVARLKIKKNFRDGIYISLYNLLGKYFFFRPLKFIIYYIKYILNLINDKFNIKNISFLFHFMSNLNVTANLISFYLAMKFKKGFTLFGAINPLKNELARLHFRNKQNKKPYELYNYKFLFKNKVKKYKRILINTYKVLKVLFRINFYINYHNINSLLYYNIYIYYNIQMLNYKKFNKFLYISAYYKNFLILNKLVLNSLAYLNTLYLITYDISNYMPYIIKYKCRIPTKLISFSSFFYKNIINYEYIKTLWWKFNNYNLRNIRHQYIEKFRSILMGFKFAFRGRFSRKQRASFIWIHEGKVPLNTLNLFIDYSFLTIVLKNSIVSIKIWLYRNLMYSSFKYILKI